VKIRDQHIPWLIFAGALLLFVPFLGSVHLFDWDEINFAECAREMIVTGDYNTVQIDFQPFWEKPPLFIWMQVLCMKIFGVNEFAARLPNAIGGAITLATLFLLGSRTSGKKFAWYWVLFYAGSLLPHFYFRSGVIDPWFNFFILLAFYQFIIYTNEFIPGQPRRLLEKRIVLSGLFLSLAVLTKGPAAIVIFGLCFLAARLLKRKPLMTWKHFGVYVAAVALPAGIWFLSLIIQGKGVVILEFIEYQVRLFTTEDAGHGHNFFYHWIVLLIGCFPVSVFALHGMFKNGNTVPFEQHSLKWMRLLFFVVLILFSIVKTKIIHYSSLCYFPLTFIGAHAVVQLEAGTFKPIKWISGLLLGVGFIISVALFIVPFFDDFVPWMAQRGWIKDPFAEASFKAGANWYGWEWIIGVMMFALTIYGMWQYRKQQIPKSIYSMTIGGVVIITLACMLIVPRVENYTQNAAIEFWKSKAGQHVYVETLGYKSYAHFFYAETKPDAVWLARFKQFLITQEETAKNTIIGPEELRRRKHNWICTGDIDRPAYFICKNTYEAQALVDCPDLKKIGEKNGYIFWERLPK
jgi:4-amino-4-deoxy-L-arabinose transferase-like glycosyltransferase